MRCETLRNMGIMALSGFGMLGTGAGRADAQVLGRHRVTVQETVVTQTRVVQPAPVVERSLVQPAPVVERSVVQPPRSSSGGSSSRRQSSRSVWSSRRRSWKSG